MVKCHHSIPKYLENLDNFWSNVALSYLSPLCPRLATAWSSSSNFNTDLLYRLN